MTSSTRVGAPSEIVPTSSHLDDAIKRFLSQVAQNQRFLVVAHTSPDGDAIGSSVAMTLFLEATGKDVVLYNRDPVPYNFGFLEGADRLVQELPQGPIDVAVILDCAEAARVGDDFAAWLGERQGAASAPIKVAVVDHHKTWNSEFADVYVRDVKAAAAGELVWRIATAAGVAMSIGLAEALYCCLMTDTGSFRYSNTSRTTFRIAGELIEAGVEPWKMTSEIYESQPRERLTLLAMVLDTLEFSGCGRLAFLRVEDKMFAAAGTDTDLTDGFINYARAIRGVEVATQIREAADGAWRISFRSRGKVDVSALAAKFGGGGHYNAAGCTIVGTSDEIVEKLSQALVDLLDTP